MMGARYLISARWYDPGHRPNRPKAWHAERLEAPEWIPLPPLVDFELHLSRLGSARILEIMMRAEPVSAANRTRPADDLGAEPCCATMKRCGICGRPAGCIRCGWGDWNPGLEGPRCARCQDSSAKRSEDVRPNGKGPHVLVHRQLWNQTRDRVAELEAKLASQERQAARACQDLQAQVAALTNERNTALDDRDALRAQVATLEDTICGLAVWFGYRREAWREAAESVRAKLAESASQVATLTRERDADRRAFEANIAKGAEGNRLMEQRAEKAERRSKNDEEWTINALRRESVMREKLTAARDDLAQEALALRVATSQVWALRVALLDYAKHARESGWPNLAEEIERRAALASEAAPADWSPSTGGELVSGAMAAGALGAAIPGQAPEAAPVCATCGGTGYVETRGTGDGDRCGEDCPACSTPSAPEAAGTGAREARCIGDCCAQGIWEFDCPCCEGTGELDESPGRPSLPCRTCSATGRVTVPVRPSPAPETTKGDYRE